MSTVSYRWPIGPGYLGLGQLIAALEQENPDRVLPFGFDNPHSYRGDYYDLAFEPAYNISVGEVLEAARSALGTTYQGWKGGDFTMSEHSTCWIAVRGEATDDRIGPMLLAAILSQPEVRA